MTSTGFEKTTVGGVSLWRANPCQAAHDYLLERLRDDHAASFISDEAQMTDRLLGNLGEFICFRIGLEEVFGSLLLFKPANAYQPLSRISKPGLDLLWVCFAETSNEDFAILQEVKTTGVEDLSYADTLPGDYAKLFGSDPNLTLHTRLIEAKNELEFSMRGPRDQVRRLTELAGVSPATSPKIRLLPSLVHDEAGNDPGGRLEAVRETLISRGWPAPSVTAWSVALDSLRARLTRLAMGEA